MNDERIEDEDGWYTIPGTTVRMRAMTPERRQKREEEIRAGLVLIQDFDLPDSENIAAISANGGSADFFLPPSAFAGVDVVEGS